MPAIARGLIPDEVSACRLRISYVALYPAGELRPRPSADGLRSRCNPLAAHATSKIESPSPPVPGDNRLVFAVKSRIEPRFHHKFITWPRHPPPRVPRRLFFV